MQNPTSMNTQNGSSFHAKFRGREWFQDMLANEANGFEKFLRFIRKMKISEITAFGDDWHVWCNGADTVDTHRPKTKDGLINMISRQRVIAQVKKHVTADVTADVTAEMQKTRILELEDQLAQMSLAMSTQSSRIEGRKRNRPGLRRSPSPATEAAGAPAWSRRQVLICPLPGHPATD